MAGGNRHIVKNPSNLTVDLPPVNLRHHAGLRHPATLYDSDVLDGFMVNGATHPRVDSAPVIAPEYAPWRHGLLP